VPSSASRVRRHRYGANHEPHGPDGRNRVEDRTIVGPAAGVDAESIPNARVDCDQHVVRHSLPVAPNKGAIGEG
jgi:hypothetical protein